MRARRLGAICAVLACWVATASATAQQVPPGSSGAHRVTGAVTGAVTIIDGDSFTVQTAGRETGVINALAAAASAIARRDLPYVWGGGHAEVDVPSIGSRGPGYNGRRVGFDCSGAVAAVLAGAGLWPAGASVPNDAGVITELFQAGVIARGAAPRADGVTLYDDPGVHIFMNIDGRFFGTTDGGGGGNSRGGAGWLDDGASDATNRAFKRWHIVPSVLKDRASYGHSFTFEGGLAQALLAPLEIGDKVRVSYAESRIGTLITSTIGYVGARTATGTVTSIARNGAAIDLVTARDRTLTLSGGLDPVILSGLVAGEDIHVLYTRTDRTLVVRSVARSSQALTSQVSGTVTAIATNHSSVTVQTATGALVKVLTDTDTELLRGVRLGDEVDVDCFQTLAHTLIASQLTDAGPPSTAPSGPPPTGTQGPPATGTQTPTGAAPSGG